MQLLPRGDQGKGIHSRDRFMKHIYKWWILLNTLTESGIAQRNSWNKKINEMEPLGTGAIRTLTVICLILPPSNNCFRRQKPTLFTQSLNFVCSGYKTTISVVGGSLFQTGHRAGCSNKNTNYFENQLMHKVAKEISHYALLIEHTLWQCSITKKHQKLVPPHPYRPLNLVKE